VTGPGGRTLFDGIGFNVFCPDRVLLPGDYTWRYRYRDAKGSLSAWSRPRSFTILENATAFPFPMDITGHEVSVEGDHSLRGRLRPSRSNVSRRPESRSTTPG